VRAILPDVEKRVITYGVQAQVDYSAKDITTAGFLTSFVPVCHGDDFSHPAARQFADSDLGVGTGVDDRW
jgi:hypothetical protein